MALVILGNGFDIASGLPTRYEDFFNYRFNELEEVILQYDKIVDLKIKSKVLDNYTHSKIKNGINMKSITEDQIKNSFKEEHSTALREETIKLKEIIDECEKEGHGSLTFWDLFFWEKYKYNDIPQSASWGDIERQIENYVLPHQRKVLTDENERSDIENLEDIVDNLTDNVFKNSKFIEYSSMIDKVEKKLTMKQYEMSKTNKAIDTDVYLDYGNLKNDVINSLVYELFFDRKKSRNQNLMNQLLKFEGNFQRYIRYIQYQLTGQKFDIYLENVNKLFSNNLSSETVRHLVLNFNYTVFSNVLSGNPVTLKKMKNDFKQLNQQTANQSYFRIIDTMYMNKQHNNQFKEKMNNFMIKGVSGKEIKVSTNNVHGTSFNSVIFGIDQSGVHAKDSQYIFTKTFRKLITSVGRESLKLPPRKDVSRIVFYGHSLSKADFSYFQSIFDYYDIYSSNVILEFYFSEYGSNAEDNREIMENNAADIIALIRDFGSNMDNTNLGENLVHKLQLENRIRVTPIKMERIHFSQFKREMGIDVLKPSLTLHKE